MLNTAGHSFNISDNYLSYGIQLYKQQKYDQALIEFKKALEKNKNNPYCYDWIGLTYKDTKKYVKALLHFDIARSIDASNMDFHHHYNECNMLLIMENNKKAMLRNYNFVEKFKDNLFYLPKYINKYKSRKMNVAYKYYSDNSYTIKMFKNHEIYLSDPKAFNDPFDVLLDISIEYNIKDLNKLYLGTMLNENAFQQLENKKSLTIDSIDPNMIYQASPDYFFNLFGAKKGDDDKKEIIFDDLQHGKEREYSLQNYPDARSHIVSILRIACFTEVKNSILMWSHYANSHKGVCIGFKTYDNFGNIKCFKFEKDNFKKDDLENDNLKYNTYSHFEHGFIPFIKVKYQNMKNTAYKFMAGNAIIDMFHFGRMVMTKGKVWEYEKEYRIVIPQDTIIQVDEKHKNFAIKFDPKEISEIIFGINTRNNFKKRIFNIINKYPNNGEWITFYQCYRGKTNRTVEMKKVIYCKKKKEFVDNTN